MPTAKHINIIVIVAALVLLQFEARAEMHGDMVRLEQAYIPALTLAARGDGRAMQAVEGLYEAWIAFKQVHAYSGGDPRCDFDLDEIEWHVLEARRLAQQGEWEKAHAVLEPIRHILMSMRERRGMDYYLDEFTRYHLSLARMIELLDGPQPVDYASVQQQYQRMLMIWRRIQRRDINPYAYGLDMQRFETLQRLLQEQTRQQLRLQAPLQARDGESLLRLARGLEQGLMEAIGCFGRFPAAA